MERSRLASEKARSAGTASWAADSRLGVRRVDGVVDLADHGQPLDVAREAQGVRPRDVGPLGLVSAGGLVEVPLVPVARLDVGVDLLLDALALAVVVAVGAEVPGLAAVAPVLVDADAVEVLGVVDHAVERDAVLAELVIDH